MTSPVPIARPIAGPIAGPIASLIAGGVPNDPIPVGEGLSEPLGRPLARLLRRAVYDHAIADRRRVHPPCLHVGVPGEPHPVFALSESEPTDHSLRVEIVSALLRRAGTGALVWLVRTGDLEMQDVDAEWLAAARQAYAEAGRDLVFVVVNRHAWWDPRSGLRRTWRRLRVR